MGKHLVIGASGLIGGALFSRLRECNQNVIGTYKSNLSFPNLIRFDLECGDYAGMVDEIAPNDIVYILSAYSNPSWIFANQFVAERLNLIATKRFIDSLRAKNPRVIFMSSVEVFDGIKGKYNESDIPNPLNRYGMLKYEIERFLTETYPRSTIVRTGWNIGGVEKTRCVVSLTYQSLLKPDARMAKDNFFSVSSVNDTAEGLYRVSLREDLKVVHLAASETINRIDLASFIMKNSRKKKSMAFSECLFADVVYTEARGRINDLDNTVSRTVLNMQYESAYDTVMKKIIRIDNEDYA